MPKIQLKGDYGIKVIENALDFGYRHIDTAYVYSNEEIVGQAIQNWIKKNPYEHKREDLFIVTKVNLIWSYKS